MKIRIYIWIISALFLLAACTGSKEDSIEPETVTFEPTVESLTQNYQYPEWLRDAKFGIYTHWGPCTYANQYNEKIFGWYGKLMYMENQPAFKYHQEHFGDQKEFGYKDIIPLFTAPEFDAKEWASKFKAAGAKFAGPVAVHHDDFLMWDSNLSPWNAAAIGPKRDISGELEKAIRGEGLNFMASFHHGFTYRFYEHVFKYDGITAPELYGPAHDVLPREVNNTVAWKKIPRDWQEMFLAKVQEFTGKYKPDLIYFDFGLGWHDEDIKLKMYSDFYNQAIANGQPHPTVAQKQREGEQLHFSTLDLERGRMSFLTEYPWLTDDSPGSWFYYPGTQLQTANTMIDRFVDIVSKNGVLLLNIGPDHNGKIPAPYQHILDEYGKWLKVNGEAIYNTRPWFTYGEGPTTAVSDHYGAQNSANKKGSTYTSEDIRFTRSKEDNALYAFLMHWPETGKFNIKSFNVENEKNLKVELLGYGNVGFQVEADNTLSIDLAGIEKSALPVEHAWCFKLTGGKISWHPQGHYYLSSKVVFKDETQATVKVSKGEISYPIEIKHGHKNYEIVSKLKSTSGDIEILVSLYHEKDKRFKQPGAISVQLPNTANKPEIVSLGEVKVGEPGEYFLQIDIIKGDEEKIDFEELFTVVARDETILKVGDPI